MAGGSKELGERIRQLREEKRKTDPKFTGRQFSIALEISPTYLSKIETGDMPAGAELLKRIAALLDTDPDILLALGEKVDPDLNQIIVEKPQAMASFLRTASGLSDQQLTKLRGYMDALSEENKKEGNKQ
jgi:transcriptional regulator with XRE-family HTH domain